MNDHENRVIKYMMTLARAEQTGNKAMISPPANQNLPPSRCVFLQLSSFSESRAVETGKIIGFNIMHIIANKAKSNTNTDAKR